MIRFLLLLFCATLAAQAELKCPQWYTLKEDGRCYYFDFTEEESELGKIMNAAIRDCGNEKATLPIIRNEEENANLNRIIKSSIAVYDTTLIILGAICNADTRRFEWMDGSQVTYSNGLDLRSLECVQNDLRVVYRPKKGDWQTFSSQTVNSWTAICVTDPSQGLTTPGPVVTTTPTTPTPMVNECGDYDEIPNSVDPFENCFKMYPTPMSWDDASQKCFEENGYLAAIDSDAENKFFWRTALANNLNYDIHIGVSQSHEGANNWRWVDAHRNLSDYSNFSPAFPIPGGGNCVAMLTESSTAKWINEDCDTKLPFVCRRVAPAEFNAPKACPETSPNEGDIIFPPGFPYPEIPCEYILVVPAKNLIKLEILAFDVSDTKSHLDIYEGAVGNNLLSSLTGVVRTPTSITTKSSNAMKVNWKPNTKGTSNDRGFKIRYTAVPTGK